LRPTIPANCPEDIKKLIKQCWDVAPSNRPLTSTIIEVLCAHLGIALPQSKIWKASDKPFSNTETLLIDQSWKITTNARILCMKLINLKLFCGCKNGMLLIVDVITRQLTSILAHNSGIYDMSLLDNEHICIVSDDGWIKIWATQAQLKLKASVSFKSMARTLLVVSKEKASNKEIWVGGGDASGGYICIFQWDASQKIPLKLISTIIGSFKDAIQCFCLVPISFDNAAIWAGSYEMIYIIDVKSRQILMNLHTHTKSRVLSLLLVCNEVWSSGTGKIITWNKKSLKQTSQILNVHKGLIHCLELVKVPNAQIQVWSGSFDQTIAVWDVITHKCSSQFRAHSDSVQTLADSGTGEIYSSGYRDQCIKCWKFAKI